MVYSKAKSFRCNTYKKHGGGGALADRPPLCASVPLWQSLICLGSRNTGHGTQVTGHAVRPIRPIAAKRLWCNNSQRHGNSSRSGETTPLPPVSKTRRADIGDSSILVPFASRAWIQRSRVGPQQGGPAPRIRQGCW